MKLKKKEKTLSDSRNYVAIIIYPIKIGCLACLQ